MAKSFVHHPTVTTLSNTKLAFRASTLLALGLAAGLNASACDTPGDPLPAGEICGSGSIDGTAYAVDSAEIVLAVFREDAFGCGALHSHAVQATQAVFAYDLDGAAAGEIAITVAAANLVPDDPDLRKKYLPDGENQPLSDGDRESILGSVREEVIADEHPALTFVLKDLSTLDGEGTATLVATIAGSDGESDVTYTATKDGDNVKVVGSADIDGAPHGIPRNALGFCVKPVMTLNFEVTLTPGEVVCDDSVEEVPTFVPKSFPDEECGEVGYNVVYNNVIGPRCAGCHGGTLPNNPELLRGGATVPLYEWDHFRVDSLRNPGEALFTTAHEFVGLQEGLVMPPSQNGEATAMLTMPEPVTIAGTTYNTERELFDAWVEKGLGRDAQCDDDVEKKTFGLDNGQRIEEGAACGGLGYETPQADFGDATAADFFTNTCLYCHANNDPSQAPSAPAVGTLTDTENFVYEIDFNAGALPVTHPFYVDSDGDPLSFWEASIHRTEDGSMYPASEFGIYDGDPSFEAFKAWVVAGYCP